MPIAIGIGEEALAALGRGFDLANDFRLRFAKGSRGRLVKLDEKNLHDVNIPGGPTFRQVSCDIGCDKGDRMRFQSDVLEFNQMSELINQKSSVPGRLPSGFFNSLFDLTGAWLEDAKETKYLAFDGFFMTMYNLHLRASPLILRDEVKQAVPPNWDPVALARFIQTYGTHIIVGLSVGGQDVVCVRQTHSSHVSTADVKMHLEDLCTILFEDETSLSPVHRQNRAGNNKIPEVFLRISQTNNLQLSTYSETSNKDALILFSLHPGAMTGAKTILVEMNRGFSYQTYTRFDLTSTVPMTLPTGLTVIYSKRGGDVHVANHNRWLQTISANPDAIAFKFVPITSLLMGLPGSGYLSHAINLYLRYKPDIEDLRYFLEFQVPTQWAPLFNELALGPQKRKASYSSLQFRCLGPKLQVSTSQVSSENKPVVGLRLYLEGRKCNRLATHVQHLSSIPSMLTSPNLTPKMDPQWQGSEDSDAAYIEPVSWKRYSCVCTSVVKHDPAWLKQASGVFVVTGAQLVTKGTWSRKVLHLRLLYSHLPNCTIRKTEWTRSPAASQKGSFLSTISTSLSTPFMQRDNNANQPRNEPAHLNSGVYPDGPPVPVQYRKLLKFVDMSEVLRGPHDIPGHWMVTAAKLVKENGKIGLHVKFALLNYGTGHGDIID